MIDKKNYFGQHGLFYYTVGPKCLDAELDCYRSDWGIVFPKHETTRLLYG
jgi:hypothetical protein